MASLPNWWPTLRSRDKRMAFYLLVLATVVAWRFAPRSWHPTTVLETERFAISSTATPAQTRAMGEAADRLYRAYRERFRGLANYRSDHPKLKMLLYKDRDQMRYINPGMGWAEAYYQEPYCRAYYSQGESNPFHWMLHEAVHQLNREVARLNLSKWLDEGLAEYLATSRVRDGELRPGTIDPYTYPVWWLASIAKEGDLAKDLANGSVIPLRAVILDKGGPAISSHVNLYYLHWWTLAHFVFEKHTARANELLAAGGTLDAFERLIGPVDHVQPHWHAHVLRIKAAIHTPHFQRTGELPPE